MPFQDGRFQERFNGQKWNVCMAFGIGKFVHPSVTSFTLDNLVPPSKKIRWLIRLHLLFGRIIHVPLRVDIRFHVRRWF